jgi:putative membrane protein
MRAQGIGLSQTTQVPSDAEPSETPEPPESGREDVEPDPRFSYANERTFLAWIRTALGLITAGLAITQLFPSFDFPGGRRLIGLPLIGLGVLIAVFSFGNWRSNEQAMRAGRPLPRSVLPRLVAVVVSIVAVVGLIVAIFEGGDS